MIMPRERRDFKRISGVRNPSLIVIAAEGFKTEVQYFLGVQSKILKSSRIRVEILEREDPSLSEPQQVLEQLDNYKRKYGLNVNDELCMVIDRDKQSWTEAKISFIASECSNKRYLFALSNPCFEFWLLLHLRSLSNYDCEKQRAILDNKNDYLKKEIRKINGSYNSSNLRIDDFWDGVDTAINRAKTLDINPSSRWQNTLGSRVYLILEKIKRQVI